MSTGERNPGIVETNEKLGPRKRKQTSGPNNQANVFNHLGDTEVKRLRRNTARRRQYAELPEEQKENIRHKKRKRYAEKKDMLHTGNRTQMRQSKSKQPRSLKRTGNPNVQSSISNTWEGIDFNRVTHIDGRTQQIRQANNSIVIKENTNNILRGSTSSCPNAIDSSLQMVYPSDPDFPISRSVKHIIAVTNLDADNIAMEPQLTNQQKTSQQGTPTRKRKRTEVNKVLAAAKRKRSGVSCREYYCYKLQIRPNEKSILLHSGRLVQEYAVDMYVKLETSR